MNMKIFFFIWGFIEAQGNYQINCYFVQDSIHQKLIARIDSARYSIDFCFYYIHDTFPETLSTPGSQVITALRKAKVLRNVKIRVIVDDEYLRYVRRLREVGIPVFSDSGLVGFSYPMHNKFAIFDYRDHSPKTSDWVWTGSYNPGKDVHAENAIVIQSESLARLYTLEFNQMWGGDVDTIILDTSLTRFHRRKSNVLPYRKVSVGEYELSVYFSPQDSALDTIAKEIAEADSQINFCIFAFSITYPKGKAIADTMIRKWFSRPDSVFVGGVFCASEANQVWSAYPYLRDSGLLVYRDRVPIAYPGGKLHHKFVVLDNKKVITGSMNWSAAGNQTNDENTLIISGPPGNPVALAYSSEFIRRFNEAGYDVGVHSILAPKGEIDSGIAITPACSVYNRGIKDTSYWLQMKVGEFYNCSLYIDNHPARTYRYCQFPPYSLWKRGTHLVSCSTRLSIDTDRSNDKKTDSVLVQVRDVGVAVLLLPSEIDSGTSVVPACTVQNFGTTNEGPYTVRMKIGDFYNESQEITNHPPGTKIYVNFPIWNAGQRGTWAASCSTELTTDRNQTNDKQTCSVKVRVKDVGVVSILAPSGIIDSGTTVRPRVKVKNFGNERASFSVWFRIPQIYEDSLFLTLSPGDSIVSDFRPWIATIPDTYHLASFTLLADDMNRQNDSAYGSVIVRRPIHDVGVIRILAPTDTIDSGEVVIPKAIVQNFGEVEENFSVSFQIGTFYTDDTVIILSAGRIDTVRFASWIASPIGMHTTKCTTLLAGDINPINDFVLDSVYVAGMSGIKELSLFQPLPKAYSLENCVPNPFISQTVIRYSLPKESEVNLSIYNSFGNLVRLLKNGVEKPGVYKVIWNGKDNQGNKVSSGIYFYRLSTNKFTATKKVVKTE